MRSMSPWKLLALATCFLLFPSCFFLLFYLRHQSTFSNDKKKGYEAVIVNDFVPLRPCLRLSSSVITVWRHLSSPFVVIGCLRLSSFVIIVWRHLSSSFVVFVCRHLSSPCDAICLCEKKKINFAGKKRKQIFAEKKKEKKKKRRQTRNRLSPTRIPYE